MGEKLGIALSLDPLPVSSLPGAHAGKNHHHLGCVYSLPLTRRTDLDGTAGAVNLFPPKNIPKHGVFVNGVVPFKMDDLKGNILLNG